MYDYYKNYYSRSPPAMTMESAVNSPESMHMDEQRKLPSAAGTMDEFGHTFPRAKNTGRRLLEGRMPTRVHGDGEQWTGNAIVVPEMSVNTQNAVVPTITIWHEEPTQGRWK
jgi:hypothetical protein